MQLAKMTDRWGSTLAYIRLRDVESYLRHYYNGAQVETVDGLCGYDTGAGWHPGKCGNPEPCLKHGALRCFCGAQARFACPDCSGQFVCGQPVCSQHRDGCKKHQ